VSVELEHIPENGTYRLIQRVNGERFLIAPGDPRFATKWEARVWAQSNRLPVPSDPQVG
jgi:hypothetical protein